MTACCKVLLLAGLAVPLLLTRVAFMSVVALARTRSIYIITFPVIVLLIIISNFGWQAILSSVECYDPETDKWTKLVHMKKVDSTNWILGKTQCSPATCRCVVLLAGCWWIGRSTLTPSWILNSFDPPTNAWLPTTVCSRRLQTVSNLWIATKHGRGRQLLCNVLISKNLYSSWQQWPRHADVVFCHVTIINTGTMSHFIF